MNTKLEILIVEDSPTQAELLRTILEQKDYRAFLARNGEEALATMAKTRPALVISDINMPGMDGYELCRRIRANETFKQIPVILLTSLADPRDVLKGLQCGADNFITKPYDPKQLLSRVQNICTSMELRREGKMQMGVEVFFGGQRHFITSERQQILDLLLATYETAVQVNLDLNKAQEELRSLNRDLEKKVAERTAALQQELIERKRAEERIREQATLLDKARDSIMVCDLSYRVIYWNSGAERLYGWKAADIVGKSICESLYKDISSVEEDALLTTLTNGEWSGELRQQTSSGKTIIVESRRTLLSTEKGSPRSVLIINTDITEKKQLEEQFLRAQRMETIGALAGGVAHDLNNVLAPVLMASEMLEDDVTDPASRRLVETIKSSAQRGSEIVRQILSFARGGAAEQKPIQMKHILREITKLTKQTFPRGIEIRSDVANDLWLIKADPTQVDQVLMNLLVNARDAMETGGRLTLTAENIFVEDKVVPGQPQSVSGRHVLITVSDTGCGIPPATVGRIFEPFYTTKKTGAGTGLGLATVATILKGHNAFIEVQSNVGEGTTFKVYFPAVQETAASETRPAVSEVPRGNGECVLLVDDEQAFVEMSRALLESFNYRTLSAFNGADALRIYRENADKIAVLVTDSLMPNVSGSALIGEVRRINPRIPIIITTGLGSEEALEKVKGLGVSAILCKPFKPDDLLLTIRQNIANG